MKNISTLDWRVYAVKIQNADGSIKESIMTGSRLDQLLKWSTQKIIDWEEIKK